LKASIGPCQTLKVASGNPTTSFHIIVFFIRFYSQRWAFDVLTLCSASIRSTIVLMRYVSVSACPKPEVLVARQPGTGDFGMCGSQRSRKQPWLLEGAEMAGPVIQFSVSSQDTTIQHSGKDDFWAHAQDCRTHVIGNKLSIEMCLLKQKVDGSDPYGLGFCISGTFFQLFWTSLPGSLPAISLFCLCPRPGAWLATWNCFCGVLLLATASWVLIPFS